MLHEEILKALYLKSPTSQRMHRIQCLVNSKEISVKSLGSILVKAKLSIENCYPLNKPYQHVLSCFIFQYVSFLILLKYENERLKH